MERDQLYEGRYGDGSGYGYPKSTPYVEYRDHRYSDQDNKPVT